MTLADERLKELDEPNLNADERALLRCRVAADLIQAGQYESARDALGELWAGIGDSPDLKKLPPRVGAEVLLQCGALTGLLGGARNVSGVQEQAKDLLAEAVRTFQSQGEDQKASEAQCELGTCYWRLGAYDEARLLMREALKPLTDSDVELKAKIHIRRTMVEISENRYYEALSILKEAEPVFESANDALKGRWHGQQAILLFKLATMEKRPDYVDRAIIEYTAASYHYEQANHERYCALNLNNLAFLLYKLGRYRDAHEHLDRAQRIFTRLKDPSNLAQIDETRARILIAEKKYSEANRVIEGVAQTAENHGDQRLFAEALTTQGVILSRLGDSARARAALARASEISQSVGQIDIAGEALLATIEELGEQLEQEEMLNIYDQALQFLVASQEPEIIGRLLACARKVLLSKKSIQVLESRPLRVFLCHSKSDKAPVRELYERLVAENIDPWLDEKNLLPGQDWNAEITKAVHESDAVIVCLTNKSATKTGYVQKEIKYALDAADRQPEGAIFLIPLRLEECKVPDRLNRWQWVDLFEESGFPLLMSSLRERALSLSLLAPKE